MNPFRSDPDPPDDESADGQGQNDDRPVDRNEVQDVVEEYNETSSVVVDVESDEDEYLEFSEQPAEQETSSQAKRNSERKIDLPDRLDQTATRLETIEARLTIFEETKSRSQEIIDQIHSADSDTRDYQQLKDDVETAKRTVQEIRINMGEVNPSYPSFIATDMAKSMQNSEDIERSLKRISEN